MTDRRPAERRDRRTDDPRYRAALVGVLTVLPALVTGATTYLGTAAKAKDAEAKLLANYGAYVEDNLRRDEALLKRIEPCLRAEIEMRTEAHAADVLLRYEPEPGVAATPAPTPAPPVFGGEPQAQVVLDKLAEGVGWRPTR